MSAKPTAPAARIGVLALYIGPWPKWMPVFCRSAAMNPSIDFLLLGSEPLPLAAPNLHFHPTTLAGIEQRIRAKLSVQPAPLSPYKLCDLRPMFGELFDEYLASYQFWAHADLDVVFGDLRRQILTEDMLAAYDIISTNPTRMNGPLSFWRNVPAVNGLFRQNSKHIEILQTESNQVFDEIGINDIILNNRDTVRFACRATHVHPQSRGLYYWEKGRVFEEFTGRETG